MASKLKLNGTVINKCWQIQRALVIVVILLYSLTTINFSANWSFVHFAFTENEKSFWTAYLAFYNGGQAILVVECIASTISTIITDLYMIWCCWMVWGQCWITVLLPILSLIAATVLKIIRTYYEYRNIPEVIFSTLYTAFVLATTLWCTLLIIYRILTVVGVKYKADSRLRVYYHCIEVLVESSALYSISLTVFLALTICGNFGMVYLDVIAAITRGVAPTLLISRAAAGRTHPNDDDDSTASSEVDTISFQESNIESTVHETDIEAQQEQLDELVEVVKRTE
ncbi:hypothetical protein IW262DRAFT_1301503 [Armillaria fumosa]|nr:hypothetical protein IW262DRAFT_1301503 [Armillaria fumosa]